MHKCCAPFWQYGGGGYCCTTKVPRSKSDAQYTRSLNSTVRVTDSAFPNLREVSEASGKARLIRRNPNLSIQVRY